MKKVTVILNDGTVYVKDNVTYVLYTGVKVVIVTAGSKVISITTAVWVLSGVVVISTTNGVHVGLCVGEG